MQVLTLTAKIGSDGQLHLDVQTELPCGDVEIALVINPTIQQNLEQKKYDFSDLVGKLNWKGNAVDTQRSLRDDERRKSDRPSFLCINKLVGKIN